MASSKWNQVRRQHVVSRFYLAGFSDEKEQLLRAPLSLDGETHKVSISDATVRKDFYSVDLGDGDLNDFFERAFSGIEAAAADVLRGIVSRRIWPPSAQDKQSLGKWIALQHLRTEGQRNSISQIQALTIRILVGASGRNALRELIEKSEGATIDDRRLDAEWADLTKPGGPTLVGRASDHIRSVIDLLEPTAAYLADQQWSLNVFQRKTLLVSDHPVALIRDAAMPEFYGVGIFTAGGFAVPLSRHLGLVIGASPGLPDLRVPGSTFMARGLNQLAAANARTAIFLHPEDVQLLGLVNSRGPRTRELDPEIGSNMIAEEGVYSGVPPEALKAMSDFNRHGAPEERGMTLADLEWPIPGRVFGSKV